MNLAATLALLTAVAGTIIYHLAQKQVPADANPALVLIIAYLVSAVLCGLLLLTRFPLRGEPARLNVPVVSLGVAVVLIEVGFLWMYRSGWSLATGALVVNVMATVVLFGVAVALFGERPTPLQIGGAIVCVAGLAIMRG